MNRRGFFSFFAGASAAPALNIKPPTDKPLTMRAGNG